MDRKKPKLTTKAVHPYIDDITMYIHTNNDPIQRDRFENERDYFSKMIQDYVQHTTNTH